MKEIKFGTSGWRAIISEDFTFENVRLVTQAIADYVKSRSTRQPANRRTVVVGYDTRFLSKEFADEAAKVLSASGIKVLLCDRDTPTPVISYHIIKNHCSGGINFTASHNPPKYNGIKFSPDTGGPATQDITTAIEKNISHLQGRMADIYYTRNEKLISSLDPGPSYIKRMKEMIDFKSIKKAGLCVAVDFMFGTSRGYLDALLSGNVKKMELLHNYLNPYFNGKRPEPAPENIQELISGVRKKRLNLGLATDGDADRFGIVDSDGTYITPNQVITALFYHMLRTRRGKKDTVARSIATTHMVDLIARRHNIKVLETPVGFKNFVDIINSGRCIIAGEESGGLSMSGHLPEKDGIAACLLIAEMVAENRSPIKKILERIYKTYGRLYSGRIDLALTENKKKAIMDAVASGGMKEFAGIKIAKRDLRDGCKLYLSGENWILFRASGTEPIVRIYFESKSQKALLGLKRSAEKLAR